MTDQKAELQHSNLEHFPITIFATIMGMSGLTLAVQAGSYHFGLGLGVANTLYYLTGFAFFLLLMGYLAKLLQYPRAVQAEWCHPVKMAFFSAIPI
ncbi:MAG: C4-dicarboxylate ABC transporter, partial [Cohaesibacter sp.]|nr:C4-dicarboxylate ABC transporter [Cohaesibacter sp.]